MGCTCDDETEDIDLHSYRCLSCGAVGYYSSAAEEHFKHGRRDTFIEETNRDAFILPDGTQEWYRDGKLHREDGPAVIYTNGTQQWFRYGYRHRLDGPAVIWTDGTQQWFRYGKLHRCDGPAVIFAGGGEEWWLNDKRHRDDGPAVILSDGTQQWWRDDKRHRDDGPAIIEANGDQHWYLNNTEITKPILTKISPKTISVFGPMVSESYRPFSGISTGVLIYFPTEEDCLMFYLREKRN